MNKFGLSNERYKQLYDLFQSDEEIAQKIDECSLKVCENGYDIFNFDNTGMLEIEKIDSLNVFEDDEAAARQAEKDGIKIIPIDELPSDFDRRYFGWIDTPENRKAIADYCINRKQTTRWTCEDHLGNKFPSKSAMCKHYGLSSNTLDKRLKDGLTLKEALTKGVSPFAYSIHDHHGQGYQNVNSMCRHYNIDPDLFTTRLRNGWTLEEALVNERANHDDDTLCSEYDWQLSRRTQDICNSYKCIATDDRISAANTEDVQFPFEQLKRAFKVYVENCVHTYKTYAVLASDPYLKENYELMTHCYKDILSEL
jgi:hypothetical protein